MAQNDNTVTIDDESPPPSMLSVMEEDEYYPQTLQEEMNEILEAFYNIVGEDGIRQHQRHVETIFERKIADSALQRPSMAPTFELTDQDGELVVLQELLTRGPVVLVFYRGKWCPHCNATLMRLSRAVKQFQARGASVVAISPMLPDGTQYLATKQNLQFPVLSDVANTVARQYRLTL